MTYRNQIPVLLALATVALLGSCTKHISEVINRNELAVFPAPPDTAHIQFLMSLTNSDQIVQKRSKFNTFVAGKQIAKAIGKPYGTAVHDGKIYVCDLEANGFEVIDLQKNTFEFFVPQGLGQLQLPLNCSFSKDGYMYVADAERKQVVIYNKDMKFVEAIGKGKEDFKPTDVFCHNGRVYVANMKGGSIDVYDHNKFLFSIPEDGVPKNEKLYSPSNVNVTDKFVYVSDAGDFNIKKYTLEGKYVATVGGHGQSLGQFARPKGISVDEDENLYVVDALFENVQMFDKDGKLLMFFGGHYEGPGYLWLPTTVTISYDNLEYFQKYVNDRLKLKFILIVSNQFGPDKLSIYGGVEPKAHVEE